ncbi:MAG: response regulator transcription factor [Acidobacteriota bacterium]|nr:MAG: response regulator transcription factor [Acidobacteriota bacterium]
MPKVLIVEDDDAMAAALRDGFEYEGYDVTLVRDGSAGLNELTHSSPDVVILDVMLPKMSGLDVCRRTRSSGNNVPIIMLTARGQEMDKVVGLKMGADDYVTKPFSFMELMARVEAVMRRSSGQESVADVCEFGDVVVDFKGSETRKNGEPVELSALEYRLLQHLHAHRGEVLSREQLLEAVWGYDKVAVTRTVDMHIAKLRKKLEDNPRDPKFFVTIHSVGYKFCG